MPIIGHCSSIMRINTMSQHNIHLSITGMKCSGCAGHVKSALDNVIGVDSVTVNLAENGAIITGNASVDELMQAVQNAGYSATELKPTAE